MRSKQPIDPRPVMPETNHRRRRSTLAMIGQRYNMLTVLGLAGPSLVVVRCDCGITKEMKPKEVRTYISCGCQQHTGRNRRHGLNKTRTHAIWSRMRQRCGNPNHEHYADYGGRGITVCERWQVFENFLADMGECPPGLTIDRYPDNNGNYEPGNCRWATMRQQSNNRRSNKPITANGMTKTPAEWAREIGRSMSTVHRRIKQGMSPEQVVSRRKFTNVLKGTALSRKSGQRGNKASSNAEDPKAARVA